MDAITGLIGLFTGEQAFPVVCCCLLFYWIYTESKEHKQSDKNFADALLNNTIVMEKILNAIEDLKERYDNQHG